MKTRTTNFDQKKSETPSEKMQKLQDHLQEMEHFIETAAGKDVVIVIGNTGSGKSTTISHLIGNDFKRDKITGKASVCNYATGVNKKNSPIIGKKLTKSETLYPEAFCNPEAFCITNQSDTVFVDFPGFEDTGDEEARLAITIAMEKLVRKVGSIKGVVVIISEKEMDAVRGAPVKELFTTLSHIFNSANEMKPSTLFLISKKPMYLEGNDDDSNKWKEKEVKTFFTDLEEETSDTLKSQFPTSRKRNNLNVEEIERLGRLETKQEFIQGLLTHPERIAVLDITDTGKRRENLLKKISSLKPLNKDEIDFRHHDKVRRKFNRSMNKQMAEFVRHVDSMQHCKNEEKQYDDAIEMKEGHIDTNAKQMESAKQRISTLRQQLQEMGQEAKKSKKDYQEFKAEHAQKLLEYQAEQLKQSFHAKKCIDDSKQEINKIDHVIASIEEKKDITLTTIKSLKEERTTKQNDTTLVEIKNRTFSMPPRVLFDFNDIDNSWVKAGVMLFEALMRHPAKIPGRYTEYFEYDGKKGPYVGNPSITCLDNGWKVLTEGENKDHYKAIYTSPSGKRAYAKLVLHGYKKNLKSTKSDVKRLTNQIAIKKDQLSTLRSRLENDTACKDQYLKIIEGWERTLENQVKKKSNASEKGKALDNDFQSQVERTKHHKVMLGNEIQSIASSVFELDSFAQSAEREKSEYESSRTSAKLRFTQHKESVLKSQSAYTLITKFGDDFGLDKNSLRKFNQACELAASFGIHFDKPSSTSKTKRAHSTRQQGVPPVTPSWQEEGSSNGYRVHVFLGDRKKGAHQKDSPQKQTRKGAFSEKDVETAKERSISDIPLNEYATRTVEEEVREEHEQPAIESSFSPQM